MRPFTAFFLAIVLMAFAGCSRTYAPTTSAPSTSQLRIEARADGFHPESISVPAGVPTAVEFVRTADKTCNTAVVFAGTGERHELPLNQPVPVTVNVAAGQTLSFACPMDMYKGAIHTSGASAEDPDAIAYWSCSMHPSVKSQTPGTCPICAMDLVPVTKREVNTGVILVDAHRRQLIGLTTGPVERRALATEVRAVGRITMDETRVQDVTLRTDAWIETVNAGFVGKEVNRGEPLLTYFSPDLYQLQSEYLQLAGDPSRAGARAGAAQRLRLRGMDDAQIEALAKRGAAGDRLTLAAPVTGTVIEKHVVAGSQAAAGSPLFRIADLTTVWLDSEVYESDLARVAVGQSVRVTTAAQPDHEFSGTVAYVYPGLDPMTRRGRVRIEVPNPDGGLKLDAYAEVRIEMPLGERLAVPVDAVIYAGESHVAFVDLGEGRLEPRRLKVGARTPEYIEVLEGLKEGESVVTSANFLIAAESKLKSGIEKW